MRSARVVSLFAIWLVSLPCSCSSSSVTEDGPSTGAETSRPLQEVIRAALPSVVLIVNDLPNGQTRYGSGFFVAPGMILTCRHVVDEGAIGAMLYRSSRTSYTPMDGGLGRFLFENQEELIPAQIVRSDDVLDLALVQLISDDPDVLQRPALEWTEREVRQGERVLALGHPQETVWSFTEGLVGALHQGAIQHDATIGQGSSGGPLLTLQGQVVGINIAKVVSETDGVGFARPIATASWARGAPPDLSVLDLSSPGNAARSCFRVQELGLPALGDCFDWDGEWLQHREFVKEALQYEVAPAVRAGLQAYLADPKSRAGWIEQQRSVLAGFMTKPELDNPAPLEPVDARLPKKLAHELLQEAEDKVDAPVSLQTPANTWKLGRNEILGLIRRGIRVDEVRMTAEDLAWVLYSGRNTSGGPYRFTEPYRKRGQRWMQVLTPSATVLATLPQGWPTPARTADGLRAEAIARLILKFSGP